MSRTAPLFALVFAAVTLNGSVTLAVSPGCGAAPVAVCEIALDRLAPPARPADLGTARVVPATFVADDAAFDSGLAEIAPPRRPAHIAALAEAERAAPPRRPADLAARHAAAVARGPALLAAEVSRAEFAPPRRPDFDLALR